MSDIWNQRQSSASACLTIERLPAASDLPAPL